MATTAALTEARLFSFVLTKNEDTGEVALDVTWKIPVTGGYIYVPATIWTAQDGDTAAVSTEGIYSASGSALTAADVTLTGDPPADWVMDP